MGQREERKMLRELKVFLDQLERDVLRAQGAEGNLTDKYHVSLVKGKVDRVISCFKTFNNSHHLCVYL